ncbi:hypothetical protein ANO11243_095720 [Dothideomycetidae sp. 11243]|nr:hypothetical protein ANO11243_095720 [fungal sp. No.11243]
MDTVASNDHPTPTLAPGPKPGVEPVPSDDLTTQLPVPIIGVAPAIAEEKASETNIGPAILGLVVTLLDQNIIATAVPSITDHFHTVEDVGWYAIAYSLSSTGLQFLFGKLFSIYSTKSICILSQMIFIVGTLICALSVTSPMLVFGRAIAGAAVAGGAAGFFQLINDLLPLHQRAFVGSIFGVVAAVTAIVSPVIGGAITQHISWRWVFWINLPISGAAVIGMIFLLPNNTNKRIPSKDPARTWKQTLIILDLPGSILLIGFLAALLMALNWAGIKYAWSDPRIIALFVVAGVTFVALIVMQIRLEGKGVLPLKVMSTRDMSAGIWFSVCLISVMFIQEYYSPIFFQTVLGYSATHSGYMLLPCLVGTLLGISLQGAGTSYFGYYTPYMIASSVAMAVGSGLLTTWNAHTNLTQLIIFFGLAGFGTGLGCQVPQNIAQTTLSDEDLPMGMAAVLFVMHFSVSLFIAIGQVVFTNRLTVNLHQIWPAANVTAIQTAGLTNVRDVYHGDDLRLIVAAVAKSIDQVFLLTVVTACLSLIGALATRPLSMKKKKKEEEEEEEIRDTTAATEKSKDEVPTHSGEKESARVNAIQAT